MFSCCYCGQYLSESKKTKEHLIPKSKGGKNYGLNIQSCCKTCNSSRGNLDYDAWKRKINSGEYSAMISKISTFDVFVLLENIDYWQDYVNKNRSELLCYKI